MTLPSDGRLGPYELHEVIGKGGMATVYRAHQPSMDRDVAIKIISPELAAEPEFAERFEREARIIARLQHPHILPVFDFGREGETIYLVMRLMEGGNLAHELRGGALPIKRAIDLTRQIASALDYAHLRGIVHRDLKPTNVLLDNLGNAYLTDFGIAKMLSGGPTTGLTATGAVMGTPTYMAPEQWRAEPIDGRTDIYALGVIVYQMLCGQVPFSAETPHGLMYQHLDMDPPQPHTIKPDLPLTLEPVITKALAKRPEDRYASAGELAVALEEAIRQPSRLPEQTLFEQGRSGVTAAELDALEDRMVEEDLLAHATADEAPDEAPTMPTEQAPAPPTIAPPPRYVPPPPPQPVQPSSSYQPPVQQPPAYTPPYAGGYEYEPEPERMALGRWLWGIAIAAGAIVLLGVIVVLATGLLDGDNEETSRATPTVPAASPTPLDRPSAAVQSPANNTQVELGDTVEIQFSVRDNQGLTRVELRRFDRVIFSLPIGGQQLFQGYFTYEPDSTGTHTLEIVPWRDDVRGDSASVTLQVVAN
jgi:serine/threonine protein kinase